VLSAEDANSQYKFLNLPNNFVCVVDKSAGVLAADKAVETLQVNLFHSCFISYIIFLKSLFIKSGGKIIDNCKVTSVHPGDIITLKTDKEDFKARKVVLTAGGLTLNYVRRHVDVKLVNWVHGTIDQVIQII